MNINVTPEWVNDRRTLASQCYVCHSLQYLLCVGGGSEFTDNVGVVRFTNWLRHCSCGSEGWRSLPTDVRERELILVFEALQK